MQEEQDNINNGDNNGGSSSSSSSSSSSQTSDIKSCHENCLRLTPRVRFHKRLVAAEYTFELSAAEETRRTGILLHIIDASLSRWLPNFPLEVTRLVSESLLEAYTVTERAVRFGCTGCNEVRLAGPIWARYTHISGIRYITALSNKDIFGFDTQMVYDPAASTPARFVWMASDYFGMREIRTSCNTDYIVEHADITWQAVPVARSRTLITYRDVRLPRTKRAHSLLIRSMKGLKLRTIPVSYGKWPSPVFSWPRPIKKNIRLVPMNTKLQSDLVHRMFRLDCTHGATGISTKWQMMLKDIISHQSYEEASRGKIGKEEPTVSIYMPLDGTEKITQVWKADGGIFPPHYPGLVVRLPTTENFIANYSDT